MFIFSFKLSLKIYCVQHLKSMLVVLFTFFVKINKQIVMPKQCIKVFVYQSIQFAATYYFTF